MSQPLRLHYAPDNASLCVRLALEALGRPYETVLVDRSTQGQKSPDYLQLNPNGLIPTLETPQGAMFETGAILLWLADCDPGTLFPARDDPARATALTWLFWLSNTLHPTLRRCFYPHLFSNDANDIRATALNDAERQLILIDAAWPDLRHHHLLGCYLMPMLRWSRLYAGSVNPPSPDLPATLLASAQQFETLPFAQRAAIAEGLGPTPFSAPHMPNPPEGSAT